MDDLPTSEILAVSYDIRVLTDALQRILGKGTGTTFWSYDIVEGAPRSGRVLFRGIYAEGAVQVPKADAFEMALELMDLISEARYLPANPWTTRKGWEIRVASVRGNTVAIVWAANCPNIVAPGMSLEHY